MELLFLLAYWQGLAKLQLHTEKTLNTLDSVTRALGIALAPSRRKHALNLTPRNFQRKLLHDRPGR